GIGQRVLESKVRAQGTRCLVVELKALQTQPFGVDCQRSKGRAAEAGTDWRASANSCCSAGAIRIRSGTEGGSIGAISLEVEVVNEGVVFADIWSISLIFKGVEEETDPAARHELRSRLIRETGAWSEVRLLGLYESISVFTGRAKCNAVLGQPIEEALAIQRRIIGGGRQMTVSFS